MREGEGGREGERERERVVMVVLKPDPPSQIARPEPDKMPTSATTAASPLFAHVRFIAVMRAA